MQAEPDPSPSILTATARPPSDADVSATAFEPHGSHALEGVLVSANPRPRPSGEIGALALAPLTDLVRLTLDWPESVKDLEQRVGDFRFLVVEFRRDDEHLAFAQIWSEPNCEVCMEVGPGPRKGKPGFQLPASVAPLLAGRGFEPGGNANNYGKRLPTYRDGDPARIAHEFLSILTDVLGYDGSVDLSYQLKQSTHLQPSFVTHGMDATALKTLLNLWGLQAEISRDDPALLVARSEDLTFQLQLTMPVTNRPNTYWEIHLHTVLPFPQTRARELLDQVNGRPWLMKAHAEDSVGDDMVSVRLAYGVNLAGGVGLAHIRSQVFEWMGSVRHLWKTWRTSAAAQNETAGNSSQVILH